MLLLQLGSFLLELSTSQGAQAQGLVFCQELQLCNNSTGKSLNHEKKNPSKQNPAALRATAAPAPRADGSSWGCRAGKGWHRARWGWGSEPCQVDSALAMTSFPLNIPERTAHLHSLTAFEGKCLMVSTRDADINQHRTKSSSQVDGPDHTDRLRLYHTAIKYKLKGKKHLFSHPAESLNGFQQCVGHKAVFLKWKCCSYFLL